MSMIPGWDSIEGTHWWSSFYFWLSIIALMLLGVFEVVSHRYSERRDELVTAEQTETQRRHDEEMARVHRETTRLGAEAEAARARIAEAQARAAEANQKAEEERLARVKIEERLAPRSVSTEQIFEMTAALSPFSYNTIAVWVIGEDPEVGSIASTLINTLKLARWHPILWNWSGAGQISGIFVSVQENASASILEASNALLSSLNTAGLTSTKVKWSGDWEKFPGLLNGPVEPAPTEAPIRLIIGAKPRP